jgi:molybdopterin converting factor small subunit
MATVHIPTQLRPLTGGQDRVEAAGATLRQVFEALEAHWPALEGRIVTGGKIRPEIAVAIDGVMIESGLLHRLDERAEVHLIPAIGGG